MEKLRFFGLMAVTLLLAACGGGGGGMSSTSGNPALSIFVTDDLSTEYAKVWVTVQRVAVNDAAGNEVVLYEDAQGAVFNLSELDGVAALLDTASLAPGSYSDFSITLADEVTLVDKTNTAITAHLNGNGQPQTLVVSGSVTVSPGTPATAVLDFDLKRFTYDPGTGQVKPVIVLGNSGVLDSLDRVYGEVQGRVAGVTDAASFELQRGGEVITVTLQPTATVIVKDTDRIGRDTSVLVSGQAVEVYGDYDPATLTLSAVRVEADADASGTGSGTDLAKVEGWVQAFDGANLVIDVREADFMPAAATLEITNVANAVFTKGSLASLADGQWVEIKGLWESPVFSARYIEIEGGRPNWSEGDDGDAAYAPDYAEVKGTVQAVAGDAVTVTVSKAEHFVPAGDTIDIDVSQAWFKYGDASCLAAGVFLEAKGAVDSAGMDATVVEIASPCGRSGDDSAGEGATAEIKGTVTAVDGDRLTVSVVRAKHFVPDTDAVGVDIATAWFEHGSRADLAAGELIEVKGVWDGSLLTAAKVEFD